jgi:thiamine biosynthesis lipoprotein
LAPAVLEEARARVGWRLLQLNPTAQEAHLDRDGMRLDLGGIAKGFILQHALNEHVVQGTPIAMVEAGGDIVVGDAPPGKPGWSIEVPGAGPEFVKRASALRRAALATSGSTAQFVVINGVRYSHVIDPRTGLGVRHDLTTSVIAGDGATADALATALSVIGSARAAKVLAPFPDATASMYRRRQMEAGSLDPAVSGRKPPE